MEIEINGEKWVANGNKGTSSSSSKTLKTILPLVAMASMFGGLPSIKGLDTSGIDIMIEYPKIRNKTSTLPSRQRQWVVFQFEKNFTKQ